MPAMDVIVLQSGSNGNCVYVEAGGVGLLFDAGIAGTAAQERLHRHGRDICSARAVVISHDHADHVRAVGIFQRKFGLQVCVTPATLARAAERHALGKMDRPCYFRAGDVLRFDEVVVETIPTPHDGVDGVAFVIDDGHSRVGVLTDLGHVFEGLADVVASLDAVVLESNYDPQMLKRSSYPEYLKGRIRGPRGHISNREAAELLASAAGPRLQWACLAHLSQENNRPELALATHRAVLGAKLPLHVASRYDAAGIFAV